MIMMRRGVLPNVAARGAAASLTPSDLTGIIDWWDADVLASITKDGSNRISALAGQEGNLTATDLSGALNKPLYEATSFNGGPGIRFATDDSLEATISLNDATFAMYAIFHIQAAGAGYGRILSISNGGSDVGDPARFGMLRNSSNQEVGLYTTSLIAGTTVTYDAPVVYGFDADGTNWITRKNGVVDQTIAKTTTMVATELYFGTGGGSFCDMVLKAVVYVDQPIAAGQRAAFDAWCLTKAGL